MMGYRRRWMGILVFLWIWSEKEGRSPKLLLHLTIRKAFEAPFSVAVELPP
jgi:hypothetical protein